MIDVVHAQFYEVAPNEQYGLAECQNDPAEMHELSLRLFSQDSIDRWPEPRWLLPSTDWPDVVWTLEGIRLVSPRVQAVFTEFAGTRDRIQWLPATVEDRAGVRAGYVVPHFPVHVDVLSREHTDYGPGGLPVRWVLDSRRLQGLAVFVLPKSALVYLIHERVGIALAEASATGYRSQRARMV